MHPRSTKIRLPRMPLSPILLKYTARNGILNCDNLFCQVGLFVRSFMIKHLCNVITLIAYKSIKNVRKMLFFYRYSICERTSYTSSCLCRHNKVDRERVKQVGLPARSVASSSRSSVFTTTQSDWIVIRCKGSTTTSSGIGTTSMSGLAMVVVSSFKAKRSSGVRGMITSLGARFHCSTVVNGVTKLRLSPAVLRSTTGVAPGVTTYQFGMTSVMATCQYWARNGIVTLCLGRSIANPLDGAILCMHPFKWNALKPLLPNSVPFGCIVAGSMRRM